MEWIDVNDRLPEIGKENISLSDNVLAYGSSGYYEAYYDCKLEQWESYEWSHEIHVTHWMVLDPPK